MKNDQRAKHEKSTKSDAPREVAEDTSIFAAPEDPVESEPPWWRNDSRGPREVQ